MHRKPQRRSVLTAAAAAAVMSAGYSSRAAVTIFQDDFSLAGGALNATTPDVTTGAEAWEAGAAFLDNGQVNTVVGTAIGQAAHLDLTLQSGPVNGGVYTATATITNGNPDWIAFGFMANDAVATENGGNGTWAQTQFYMRHSNQGQGAGGNGQGAFGWALVRNNTTAGQNDIQFFNGENTGGNFLNVEPLPQASNTIRIDLNTINPTWTATYYLNGVQQGAVQNLAAAAITELGGIGFSRTSNGTDVGGGQIDNFSLVFEPVPASNFWNLDGDGSWDTPANWTIGVPNVAGAQAVFGGGGTEITAPRTITLPGPRTAGSVRFNNGTFSYTLAGASGALLLDNGGTISSIAANAGGHTIDVPVTVDADGVDISAAAGATLTISKAVGGAGALTKSGPGTLVLPVASTYAGDTTVSGGVLRAEAGVGLPTNTNLHLSGGVLENGQNMTRTLGGGAGQVRLTAGASGFSALGAATTVAIGGIGSPTPLAWGDPNFNPAALVLNASSATHNITLANSIDLGSALRGIQVNAGVATMTGAISGFTGGNLQVNGAGVLVVTSANNTFGGNLEIGPGTPASGAVRAVATNALGAGTIAIAPNGNASTGRLELANNISLANPINLHGRNNNSAAIQNISGNNELRNTAYISTGGGTYQIQSDAGLLTLSGAEIFAFGVAITSNATGTRIVTLQGAGAGLVSGQITNGAGIVNLVKSGTGTWTLSNSNTQTGTMSINDGTLVVANVGALGAGPGPIIEATGHGRLAPGLPSAVKLPSLTVTGGTASLDMTDNDLIVNNTTPTSTIVGYLTTGRAGGDWNGRGIASSTAENNPNNNTALGVLTGAEYDTFGGGGIFNGTSYVPTDTLIKYTWNGDTNFSGTVNFDDYVRVDVGFNTNLTGWGNGDFNYSGGVNFDDYVLLDVAFNTQSGTLGRAVAYLTGDDRSGVGLDEPGVEEVVQHFAQFGLPYATAFLAAVPEPTSLALLGVPAIAGIARVRRRRPRPVRIADD